MIIEINGYTIDLQGGTIVVANQPISSVITKETEIHVLRGVSATLGSDLVDNFYHDTERGQDKKECGNLLIEGLIELSHIYLSHKEFAYGFERSPLEDFLR